MSLGELLKTRYEIELPQFYATKIKSIDTYYGYIAYSEIFVHEGNVQKATNLLTELISHNQSRPEAYIQLWKIWYEREKRYDLAEDLMTRAFLRVNDAEYDGYIIIFSLNLAKTYSKQKKFNYAFEILQDKFVEHPEFPIFLYQYGRLCAKAENLAFIGSAIGALRECLRVCDEKRHAKINYWLGRAYYFNKQFFESYLSINLSLDKLGVSNHKKAAQLRDILKVIKAAISKAEVIYNAWTKKSDLNRCLEACEEALEFDIIRGIKAEILWKIGNPGKTIDFLQWCVQDKPKDLPRYFQLAKYLKKSRNYQDLNKICKKMLKISKNTQVVTQEWMASNIWYAQSQALLKQPENALPLLQCLSKVFPPLPYIQTPYTKYLIKAKTSSDFIFAAQKANKYQVYDFTNTRNSVAFATENTISSFEDPGHFDINNRRNFTEDFINDSVEDESLIEKSNFVGQESERWSITQKSFDFTMSRLSERGFMTYGTGNVPTGNGVFVGFSASSEIWFLYYIGKICLGSKMNFEDGLCAIQDFLSLTVCEKNPVVKELQNAKGNYIKAFLLIAIEKKDQGLVLLKELRTSLEKLSLRKKLETTLDYISNQ